MNAWRDQLVQFSAAIRGAESLPHDMIGGLGYPLTSALDIYRNNYRGSLQDALVAAYPVVEKIVLTGHAMHSCWAFMLGIHLGIPAGHRIHITLRMRCFFYQHR